MRTASLVLAAALSMLLAGMTAPATADDRVAPPGKSPSRLACERACHDDHGAWVDQCIAFHDPREILPSARGQCVDAGAERLHRCLATCR